MYAALNLLPSPNFLTDIHFDQLATAGYCLTDQLLGADDINALQTYYLGRPRRAAAITGQLDRNVRGDEIYWLESEHQVDREYLEWLVTLGNILNHAFFTGLNNVEAHFAAYPAGSFYKSHVDNPRGQTARVFSTVLYLNGEWTEGDGGELLLTDRTGQQHLIQPRGGRLAIFCSDLLHSVQAARRPRYAITGWLRSESPGR